MKIDLYMTMMSPPCRAVLALADTIGVDVNIKTINLKEGQNQTPEYLKLNPNHTVPTLVDGDLVLTESRAMLTYLVEKYAAGNSLYPKDPVARAIINNVMFYEASTMNPAAKAVFYPKFFLKQDVPEEVINNFKEKIQVLDQMLGDKKFFGGDQVSVADISVASGASGMPTLMINETKSFFSDKLTEYLKRVNQAVPPIKKYGDEAAAMWEAQN